MIGPLDSDAAGAQIGEHGIDAILVDGTQPGIGQAQTHPTIFGFDPEAAILQIWQKATLGFVVGVGNIVASIGAFPVTWQTRAIKHLIERLKSGPKIPVPLVFDH